MPDEMYLAREPMPLPSGQNLPRLRGSQRDARQFGEHITAGFSDAWAALQTSKAEVSRILWKHSECRVRVIFRSTYEYAFILRESNHPYHLGDAIDRDRYFDQMWESVAEDPKRRQLYLAEREDLWRGDIPIFISRPGSTSLWTSTGEEFRHFFDTSGIQAAERRLDSLNQDNLSRQLQFIDVSLSSAAASQDPPHNRWQPQCDSFESPLVAATAIAGHLAREAFTSEGQAAWVTTNELAPGFAPVVHGRDLYAGAPGATDVPVGART